MKFRMDEIRAACEAEAARQGSLTPEQRATEDEELHREKASMRAALAAFDPERHMPDITEEPTE